MPKQTLGLGVAANDNTGDTLRLGGQKINDNFNEIYNALSTDGTTITFDASSMDLDSLVDVDLTTNAPTNEQYLQFNGVKWVPVTHEVDGRVTGHLVPDANVTWDLGSSTHRFRDLYLSNNTLHLGNISISAGPNGIEQKNVLGVYDCVINPHVMGNGVYANSISVTAVGTLPDVVNPFSDMTERSFPGLNINTRNPVQPLEGVKFTLSYVSNGVAKTFSTLKSDHDYISNPPKDTNKFAEDLMSFGSYGTLTVYNREPLVDGVAEEIANASQVVLTITKEFVPAEPEVSAEELEESDVVVDTSDINLFSYSETPIGTANGNWHFDPLGSYETSDIAGVSKEHLPGLDTSLFTDAEDTATNFIDNYPGFQPGIEAQVKITKPTGEVVTYGPVPDHRKTEPGISGFQITGYKTIRLIGDAATDYSTGTSFAFEIKQVATDNIITGSLIPDTDVVYDLGSPSKRFRDLYISGSSIHFGTQKISDENGQIKFSAPLAPFEANTEVYFTTDKFVSTHPRQLTFNDDLPGVIVDVLNMKTTIEPEYDINLKINVAQGPTTLHNEIDVVADRLLSATSEAVIASHDEIEFVKQPGNRINGVVEANLRNPEHRYIGLRKGYYATLKVKLSDGPNRLIAEIDSMNHFRPEEHYQFQNSSDPEISIVQFTHGWPDVLDGLDPSDEGYFEINAQHQPILYMRRPDTGEILEVPRRSGFKDNIDREIYSGGDFFTEGLDTANKRTGNFWVYNQLLKSDGSKVDGKQYSDYLKLIRAENNNGTWVDDGGVTRSAVWVEYYKISQSEEALVNVYHPLTKDKPVEHSNYFQFTSKNRIKLIKGTRSDSKAIDFVKKAYEDQSKELSLTLTINRQDRVEYNLKPAGSVFDATKSVSANYPDQVGSNTFVVVNSRCLSLLNPDIYNNYKQGYLARRPHLWFDPKKASLELSITKFDPTKKGDVLTAEGEQNLENKTLGKEGSPTYIDGHFIPTQNIAYDLGSPENRFRDLYISADSLNIGGTKLSTKGGSLTVATVESISKMIPDNKNSYFPQWSVGNTDWSGKIGNKITLYCGHPGDDDNEHDTPLVSGDGYDDSWAARDKPWNDNYNYSLFCDLKQQVTVHKEFPILEVSSPVAHPGWSVEPNAELSGSSTKTADASGGDTSSQMLDITLRDLGVQSNQDGLFKLTYKFWNPKSTHISEQVSDYLIRVTPGVPPILETTSTTNLFKYWGNTPYNVKYTAYRNDGSVNEYVTLDIVPSEVENNWVKSYIDSSWKFTEASDELDQIVSGSSKYELASGDANTTPIFGFTLGNALQKFVINGVAFTDSLNFEQTNLNTAYTPTFAGANWKWDAADSKPLIIIHSIEKEGNDTFYYRLYAMENQTDSYNLVKDSDGQSAYNSPGFLTEFRFTDGFNQGSVLERTSRSRPLSNHMLYTYNNLYHQVLVQHDLPNKSSYNLKFACDYEFLSEMPWSDHQLNSNSHHEKVFWQNMFYGSGRLEVDTLGAGTTVIPMPHLQYYTAQRVSYEKAVTHKYDASIRHERVEKWMVLEGMASIDLNKYPFKKLGTPIVDFDDRYVLTARLYDSQTGIDQNKPFKEYKHLTKDKYEFEVTGAVLHKAGDRTEGIVVDAFGNVTFKVRNPETFIADMSKCIKLKISLLAQPGIYTYKVGNSNDEYYNWSSTEKPYAVYAFANTYVNLFTTANTQIGSGADAALIYYHSDDAWFETYKKSEDPAVTSINTALIDTSNQLNATIANTANQLSNSISTTQNLANSTAQSVTGIQNELIKALKIQSGMSVPTSNTAPGTMGDMVIDGDTVYIAVANNKWGRLTLDFNF